MTVSSNKDDDFPHIHKCTMPLQSVIRERLEISSSHLRMQNNNIKLESAGVSQQLTQSNCKVECVNNLRFSFLHLNLFYSLHFCIHISCQVFLLLFSSITFSFVYCYVIDGSDIGLHSEGKSVIEQLFSMLKQMSKLHKLTHRILLCMFVRSNRIQCRRFVLF